MTQSTKPVCPFRDPAFVMDVGDPCPVCGDQGTFPVYETEMHCVDFLEKVETMRLRMQEVWQP